MNILREVKVYDMYWHIMYGSNIHKVNRTVDSVSLFTWQDEQICFQIHDSEGFF